MTDPKQILATPMQPDNSAGAETVGDYLVKLLERIWDETDAFSGKRPFGTSGWEYEPMIALVKAGHVIGSFDEAGYLKEIDSDEANRLIVSAISGLRTSWATD